MGDDQVYITFRISEGLRKKLKVQAAEEGKKIQEILCELVEKYLNGG